MQELKRVFFSKKFIGILFFLLILNGYFVWQEQQIDKAESEYYEENYKGNYIQDEKKIYLELLKNYKQMGIESAVLEIQDYHESWLESLGKNDKEENSNIDKEDLENNVRLQIYEQIEYIHEYPNYFQKIKQSAEDMKQVPILGADGSFSRRNIDKTVRDYERLKDVELKLDNERAVQAFTDCTFTGLLILVMAVVVVFILLEERKKGLWQFIYAMPKGRSYLAAVRCITIFLAVCFSGILLQGETLLITGSYYGGFGDLSRAVQSNPEFSNCVLEISMGMYLFLTIFIKIMVCTLVGFIFWAAVSSLKSHAGVFLVLAVLIAGEYLLYTKITKQSAWKQWKYMNLFCFLDSGNTLTTYDNLNLFGYPFDVSTLLFFVVFLLLFLICIGVILLGKQKPFQQAESIVSKIYEKMMFRIKPYRHNSLLLHESYKVFIRQKCAFIIIVLLFLCVKMVNTEEIYFDYGTTIYNHYMNQIEGSLTEEKITYLESEKNIWIDKIETSQRKIQEYDMLLEQGADEKQYQQIFLNRQEYEQEVKKIQNYIIGEQIVSELIEDAGRLQQLQQKGVNAGFVNKIGYDMYLGRGSNSNCMKQTMLMLAFLSVALAGIQSYEKSQNSEALIKSTKLGRKTLVRKKQVICAVTSFLVFLPVTVVGYYNIRTTYGMGCLGVAVQSLEFFQEFPFSLTIGGLLLCLWIVRYFMLLCVAMIIMFVSGKTKNMILSLVLCILVILVPASIVYMGFSEISFLSVLSPVMVTYFWNLYGFHGIMWWLPCFGVLVLGTICAYLIKKE